MIDIVINQFVFPNYVGINPQSAKTYLAFPLKVAKRKNRCGYAIVLITNGQSKEYISLNAAAHQTGISIFTLRQYLKSGKTYYRRSNGDKIQVKRISK